jgi:hypothetical protein
MTKSSLLAVQGTLKGYDQLLNLVLDECIEYLQGASLLSSRRLCSSLTLHPLLSPAADPDRNPVQFWSFRTHPTLGLSHSKAMLSNTSPEASAHDVCTVSCTRLPLATCFLKLDALLRYSTTGQPCSTLRTVSFKSKLSVTNLVVAFVRAHFIGSADAEP